jgi:F-type H+-transporting ATPase subunit b
VISLQPLFEGLGINVPDLIAQIINFGVLFILLWFVGYKPILRMLDERSRKIKESMDQTEQLKEQTARAEEELKKQIALGRQEGQEIISRALRTGEELKQKAQQEAKQESETLIVQARSEIQRERDEAVDVIRKEFADLTITAAEKVIDRTLDKQVHRDIIDKVLEQSTQRNG